MQKGGDGIISAPGLQIRRGPYILQQDQPHWSSPPFCSKIAFVHRSQSLVQSSFVCWQKPPTITGSAACHQCSPGRSVNLFWLGKTLILTVCCAVISSWPNSWKILSHFNLLLPDPLFRVGLSILLTFSEGHNNETRLYPLSSSVNGEDCGVGASAVSLQSKVSYQQGASLLDCSLSTHTRLHLFRSRCLLRKCLFMLSYLSLICWICISWFADPILSGGWTALLFPLISVITVFGKHLNFLICLSDYSAPESCLTGSWRKPRWHKM